MEKKMTSPGDNYADDSSLKRAIYVTNQIKKRRDCKMKQIIENFDCPISKYPEEERPNMGIHDDAWNHVLKQNIEPKFVFAHKDILKKHPETSLYYRGISTLPLKRAQKVVSSIKKWEDGERRENSIEDCNRISCLYNATISTIILGSTDWALCNGYRNILATLGITEDGKIRNIIGRRGEDVVRDIIIEQLDKKKLIRMDVIKRNKIYELSGNNKKITMEFSSEPDIAFKINDKIVGTVEIKSGLDPAGALERLGAIKKSFEETPDNSKNIAILGVVTPEMKKRIEEMHIDYFTLEGIESNPMDFLNTIFHHTLKLTDRDI